jgi:hypothetical protein
MKSQSPSRALGKTRKALGLGVLGFLASVSVLAVIQVMVAPAHTWREQDFAEARRVALVVGILGFVGFAVVGHFRANRALPELVRWCAMGAAVGAVTAVVVAVVHCWGLDHFQAQGAKYFHMVRTFPIAVGLGAVTAGVASVVRRRRGAGG